MGALNQKERMWTLAKELVCLPYSFVTNGSGVMVAASQRGLGITVTRTGVGTANLVVNGKTFKLVHATFQPWAPLGTATEGATEQCQISDMTGNDTIPLVYKVSGSAAEWPASPAVFGGVLWLYDTSINSK